MAVQSEAVPGNDRPARRSTSEPDRLGLPSSVPVSRLTIFCYALVGALLTGWFLFGWLVLRQGFVDSVGESLGTAFALLLIVSIVGTLRRASR